MKPKAPKAKSKKKAPAVRAGELLYHAAHGLCRVMEVERTSDRGTNLVLTPKVPGKMGIRFVVPADGLEATGFHPLVSPAEAKRVLEYFRDGKPEEAFPAPGESSPGFAAENQTWALARTLLACCHDKVRDTKDKRLREAIDRSVRALVGELAYVLKLTPEQMVGRMRETLGSSTRKNVLLTTSLNAILED